MPGAVWGYSPPLHAEVCEDACIRHGEGADDFAWIVDFKKGVGLAHQLFRVIKIIRCKKLVKVFVSAAERGASGCVTDVRESRQTNE